MSLIETGLALLVAAIIALIAYPQYQQYRSDELASEEADNITRYVAKTQSRYSSDTNFALVSTTTLQNNGILPKENRYGGTITAVPNAVITANDSALFTTNQYTQHGCREVVPRIATVARTVSVNGTVVKPTDQPLNLDSIGTACTTALNTVAFAVSR